MSDKLDRIFEMQSMLNDYVFEKKGITDTQGHALKMKTIYEAGAAETAKGPNSDTNRWLANYLAALNDESRELGEELLWKWWSKDSLSMQNIRVEIVDQLHFWVSLALTAGMDANKVFDIYSKKNQVNIDRQNKDYSKSNKNENDNLNIE